ncbi:MAG: TspO/MBR family protein [Pseudomonadota bacterium]
MGQSRPILIASGSAVLVAFLGGLASRPGAWYETLDKSALTPPNWVFAPAWTIIYALCVIAAVLGCRSAQTSATRAWLISLFFINAVFNVLWSFFFFTLQRPDWALAEVAALWASVASLILLLRSQSRIASVCLFPYLIWVSFAAYLNYQVVLLNGPFG